MLESRRPAADSAIVAAYQEVGAIWTRAGAEISATLQQKAAAALAPLISFIGLCNAAASVFPNCGFGELARSEIPDFVRPHYFLLNQQVSFPGAPTRSVAAITNQDAETVAFLAEFSPLASLIKEGEKAAKRAAKAHQAQIDRQADEERARSGAAGSNVKPFRSHRAMA